MNVDATLAIVAGILTASNAALSARYVPAEEECEDDEIQICCLDDPLPVSIQIGPGYIGTNRYFYDATGQLEAMQSLYLGVNIRAAAQSAATAISAL